MIRHIQTLTAERADGHTKAGLPGNCLQVAVASLLDLPIEEVPHFAVYADWFGHMRRWARGRGGDFTYMPLPVPRQWADAWQGYLDWADSTPGDRHLLMDGPSPRGTFAHVVVGNLDLSLAHDPHPSGAGLTKVTGAYLYCAPYDPPPATAALTASPLRPVDWTHRIPGPDLATRMDGGPWLGTAVLAALRENC